MNELFPLDPPPDRLLERGEAAAEFYEELEKHPSYPYEVLA
jgi:hypothetical protein